PASHTWRFTFGQRHQICLPLISPTSMARSAPFLVGCHWAASLGTRAATEASGATRCPLQNGQPVLRLARAVTLAAQRWPFLQRHQTLARAPRTTSLGVSFPLRGWYHSLLKRGWVAARLLLDVAVRLAR